MWYFPLMVKTEGTLLLKLLEHVMTMLGEEDDHLTLPTWAVPTPTYYTPRIVFKCENHMMAYLYGNETTCSGICNVRWSCLGLTSHGLHEPIRSTYDAAIRQGAYLRRSRSRSIPLYTTSSWQFDRRKCSSRIRAVHQCTDALFRQHRQSRSIPSCGSRTRFYFVPESVWRVIENVMLLYKVWVDLVGMANILDEATR